MKEHSRQKIFDKILEHVELKNKKTLEIGCGRGRISSLLSTETHTLIAIDPDETAIEYARATIPQVDFRVGSGEKLDFPSNCFDLVLFTLSLHHLNCPKAIIEATRVSKPCGKILIIEPVIDGEIEIIFSFLHNENNEKKFAQQSIVNSGLTVEKSEVFSAEWFFDNQADLLKSVFEYYNMPSDPHGAEAISNYLGEKIKLSPIVCQDKMMFQMLNVSTEQS